MKFEDIISNSFKFPFRDYKRLVAIFILFFILLILPAGAYFKNEIVIYVGIIADILFVLIFPGYLVSVVRQGCVEDHHIPRINLKTNLICTLKLFVLHLVYLIIVALILLIILFAIGAFRNPVDLFMMFANGPFDFINSLQLLFAVVFLINLIFSIIISIAEARLARFNSLSKALNVVGVCGDIKNIGIARVIGWYFVMAVLIGLINFLAIFLIFVPYVGFIAYLCIAYPIILLIYNFSLGLLYANVSEDNDDDIDKFEKELQRLKLLGR